LIRTARRWLAAMTLAVVQANGGSVMADTSLQEHMRIEVPGPRDDLAWHGFDCPEADGVPALRVELGAPEAMMWFDMDQPVAALTDQSILSARQIAQGYVPTDRDRLELALVCAEPNLDLVATGLDYARDAAALWQVAPLQVRGRGIDRGDLLAATQVSDVDTIVRIGTWRMGARLVILRATYQAEHAEMAEPMLARIFGALRAAAPVVDPVRESLKSWPIGPQDAPLTVRLPSNWRLLGSDSAAGANATMHIFADERDRDGNGALTLVWRRITAAQSDELVAALATLDAPMARKISADVVDMQMSNLMSPDTPYRLDGELTALPHEDETVGLGSQIFVDALTLADQTTRISARTEVVAGRSQMLAIGALAAYPSAEETRARFFHTVFAMETVKEALRAELESK